MTGVTDVIESEILELKATVPKVAELSADYLFSLVCFKFFFNNGRLDNKDYNDCFVDGRDDGGIDVVALDESGDQERLVLIQSKKVSDIAKQDVVDIFLRMDHTLRDFEGLRTAQYNKRLKRVLKEKLSQVEDRATIWAMVLFTNSEPASKYRQVVTDEIAKVEELGRYETNVYYRDQIVEQITNVRTPRQFVAEGRVRIANDHGAIQYHENGLLVDVSAHSLRDLYDLYRDKGLFEQDFRYFVRNKRIDDKIMETLHKRRGDFWFLNNGIIIGCKHFDPDGDNVKLYDFSIINGCQTTTLIGQYKGSKQGEDFYLPCKIVKPAPGQDFVEFIRDIAEASNTQKPISDRDLKANKPEQRHLQKEVKKSEPKIYLGIKRGERLVSPAQKKHLEEWQCPSNELYGQLVLSFHLQSPGTARSAKKRIFSDESVYDRLFKRPVDKPNAVDLLKLNSLCIQFQNGFPDTSFTGEDMLSVVINGRLVILAIVGFLLKVKRGLLQPKKFSEKSEWRDELGRDNLRGALFRQPVPDDFEDHVTSLFTDIAAELGSLYEPRAKEYKTVSNFFKSDVTYRDTILRHLINRYLMNPMKKKEMDGYLEVFE